ncbi:MAG: hypothetical protein ACRET2_16510 [Steroidobacteraceae bacterium]
MSAPRNRPAFAIGQERREIVRQLMLERAERFPLLWPLTADQMKGELQRQGVYLSVSTVEWHMQEIRKQARREAEDPARKIAEKNDVSSAPGMV